MIPVDLFIPHAAQSEMFQASRVPSGHGFPAAIQNPQPDGRRLACPNVIRRLLRTANYGLRANLKRLSGQSPPERDRQFHYLARLRHLALSKGCPVLSIDTKNKELVGNFANDGATRTLL